MNQKSRGFTLAEILVAMAIMAVVGTMLVVIFANTLRGSNKSQILANIKQNGQAVLENMDKTIRGADNVCVSNGGGTLVVIKNGTYTRYRFVPQNNDNGAIGNCGSLNSSVNGCIQQDNTIQPTPPATRSDIQVFIDSLCQTDTDPLTPPVITLTDTNPQSGVSAVPVKNELGSDLSIFARNILPGFKDSVTIRFALKPGVKAPPILSSQIDPVAFDTTIGLR